MNTQVKNNPLKSLAELYQLWKQLGDIPVSEGSDEIEEQFLSFEVGTPREEIWSWFERQNRNFIVGDVMQGIRRTECE